MSDKRPLLVIVSGAPGSGKTTLARKLAEHMRLIHIPRDEFFWSLTYTADQVSGERLTDVPAYWEALVYLAKHNVSLVADGTLYKGLSEPDIEHYLKPVAEIVNVHCRAENEYERFRAREVERHERYGADIGWLDRHKKRLEEMYELTVDPLELGCPCIEVNTTAAYDPAISLIAEQIGDRNNILKEGART